MLDILGKAFSEGKIEELRSLLAEDCLYVSQFSGKTVQGIDETLARMTYVYSNLDSTNSYICKPVEVESILAEGVTLCDLAEASDANVIPEGLLLFQGTLEKPVALAVCTLNDDGKINKILLTRDSNMVSTDRYAGGVGPDSPLDLPCTVKPYDHGKPDSNRVRETDTEETASKTYIWKHADSFAKRWLPDRGYRVLESAIFDDCIAYRCKDNNDNPYTVFMYAYGKKRTTKVDSESCAKLARVPFAQGSTIFVLYLNVRRYIQGAEIKYEVRNCYGSKDSQPELWLLKDVEGALRLVYYPRKGVIDRIYHLMYAYNHESLDVYNSIISDEKFSLEHMSKQVDMPDSALGMYRWFLKFHRSPKFGDMKIGYARFNGISYSMTPYVEGFGFVGITVNNESNKIEEIRRYFFDDEENNCSEFIKTEEREPEDLFDHVPKLVKVVPLKPVHTERFAVKAFFDNGECRKYVLPIKREEWEKEVFSYEQTPFGSYVFTDKIWASAKVADHYIAEYVDYPERGPALVLKNDFYIAGMKIYMDGTPYSEPELVDEVVYTDEKYRIRKQWTWDADSVYEDEETGLLKVLLSGLAFNYKGKSTFASIDGKRLISLTFDCLDSFRDGAAMVAIRGHGYGFVNKEMQHIVPMVYDNAHAFSDGTAEVKRNGLWVDIDKEGNELTPSCMLDANKFQELIRCDDGKYLASILKLRQEDLAFHSDNEEDAGIWGYYDEKGEEILAPQYIYAYPFEGGIAFVAKGEWTKDSKWDNKYNKGRYWTEEELWGGIDTNGNEVIPCIFDEIYRFDNTDDVFAAHFGGWDNGKWGIIDRTGKWLADPKFDSIDREYEDGLFVYRTKTGSDDSEEMLCGIYDLNNHKILFEPRFENVTFLDDGDFCVQEYDEQLCKNIDKIIDRNGKERFKSEYSYICAWEAPYEVSKWVDRVRLTGLIDRNGNELLPCVHRIGFRGIDYEHRRFVFIEDNLQGVKDFDGNILIPAKYHKVFLNEHPFISVYVGKTNHLEGLITDDGRTVIPAEYNSISWCKDGKHFFCYKDGCSEMYLVEEI